MLDLGVTRSFAVGTCGPNKTTILTGGSELAGGSPERAEHPRRRPRRGTQRRDQQARRLGDPDRLQRTRQDRRQRLLRGGAGPPRAQHPGARAAGRARRVEGRPRRRDLRRERARPRVPGRLGVRPPLGLLPEDRRIPGSNGKCPLGATKLDDGGCAYVFAVGPGDPTGGTIVPIDQLPGGRTSPCRNKKFGRSKLAVVGTNKRDKINGSTGRDRIFSFGGKDSVGAGRGDDCVDAGTASDVVDGDTGADLLLGKTSRDILNGGGGKDKVVAGDGNDSINGGSGRGQPAGRQGPRQDRRRVGQRPPPGRSRP